MLKLNYFLADIFILSAEKQPIKLSWRKIEWLHTTDMGIKEIADELDFSDQSVFGKFFVKATGVSPLKYRKR